MNDRGHVDTSREYRRQSGAQDCAMHEVVLRGASSGMGMVDCEEMIGLQDLAAARCLWNSHGGR